MKLFSVEVNAFILAFLLTLIFQQEYEDSLFNFVTFIIKLCKWYKWMFLINVPWDALLTSLQRCIVPLYVDFFLRDIREFS